MPAAPEQATVLVDYAHTPDALESALKTLQAVCPGNLWVVFGCGGDRDVMKRPLMGEVAARFADRTVITNDNPRSEDPVAIASAIVSGLPPSFTAADSVAALGPKNYSVVLDRQQAIEAVLKCARPTDVVLIAGKGHEKFQTVGIEKTPFDDVEVAKEGIARRGGLMTCISADFLRDALREHLSAAVEVEGLFKGVETDSRKSKDGALFVALAGDRFDGHDFVVDVLRKNSGAALVHKRLPQYEAFGAKVIEVQDTLKALQQLARAHLQTIDATRIGVTGSNGKTTKRD